MPKRRSILGFTLVEVMITTAIIGLLASLAVPNFMQANANTQNRIFASEIKVAGHAFVQYAMENGEYPRDRGPRGIPSGMDEYLAKLNWTEDTALGGSWDWDYKVFGILAAVSVHRPDCNAERMADIDKIIDDGNLNTGQFRKRSSGYMYILEEL